MPEPPLLRPAFQHFQLCLHGHEHAHTSISWTEPDWPHTQSEPGSLNVHLGRQAVRQAGCAGAANSAKNYTAFPFLQPGKLRDAAGVLEGCPGYNPRTLKIPASWFKDAKVSPGQQQW